MRVRIEHEIGHARSGARVESLIDAGLVKAGTNRLRTDHGDRFTRVIAGREDGFGFGGDVEWGDHGCLEIGGDDKDLMKRSLLYQTELRSREIGKVGPVGFEPTTGGLIAM
jgi:hypothetical protein